MEGMFTIFDGVGRVQLYEVRRLRNRPLIFSVPVMSLGDLHNTPPAAMASKL
jgi:hypothetical protein